MILPTIGDADADPTRAENRGEVVAAETVFLLARGNFGR